MVEHPHKYQLPTPYSFWDTSGQTFPAARLPDHPPTQQETTGENNTLSALKGCWVINLVTYTSLAKVDPFMHLFKHLDKYKLPNIIQG